MNIDGLRIFMSFRRKVPTVEDIYTHPSIHLHYLFPLSLHHRSIYLRLTYTPPPHLRYINGASTNPDAHVFACAGAAVRKGLEVAHKLGAENFVFWGGREGFQTLLNTDLNKEMQHMANFFRMAVGRWSTKDNYIGNEW